MKVSYRPYRYVKAPPPKPLDPHQQAVMSALRLGSVFVVGIGVVMLYFTVAPAISWQFFSSKTQELVNPFTRTQSAKSNNLILGVSASATPKAVAKQGKKVAVKKLSDGFSYFTNENDVKKASVKEFYISIPKINIHNAKVIANTNEFDKNLGHLPGTGFPGEIGNPFITGHSSLPSLFSASNYKTIFANLPKLDILDEIVITAGNATYTYTVEKHFVVDPTDVSVIDSPDPFGKYLTLMTCVPPGFNTKRLIVLARLEE